jgi:hypothetical protein
VHNLGFLGTAINCKSPISLFRGVVHVFTHNIIAAHYSINPRRWRTPALKKMRSKVHNNIFWRSFKWNARQGWKLNENETRERAKKHTVASYFEFHRLFLLFISFRKTPKKNHALNFILCTLCLQEHTWFFIHSRYTNIREREWERERETKGTHTFEYLCSKFKEDILENACVSFFSSASFSFWGALCIFFFVL